MPMRIELYPENWSEIAFRIKTAADWTCASCGRLCRMPGQDWTSFIHIIKDKHGDDMACEVTVKPRRFVLTVAHLDRNPANSDEANLIALCTVCHLHYDRPHNVKSAAKTRWRKKEQRAKDAGQLKLL